MIVLAASWSVAPAPPCQESNARHAEIFFHRAKKTWKALRAIAVSPASAEPRARPKQEKCRRKHQHLDAAHGDPR